MSKGALRGMDLASPEQDQAEVTMSRWPGVPSFSPPLLRPLSSGAPSGWIPDGFQQGWEAMRKFLKSLEGGEGGGMVDSNVRGGGCWPPSPP